MIWQFLIASILVTLMPGPDILFVLTQSIGRGARAAFPVALGLCSGLVFHTAAVACGVAVILQSSPMLFAILKYCGAVYLICLGIKAVAIARKAKPDDGKADARVGRVSYRGLYRQGVTMNLLNPKVALFFLSFLPGFVPADTASPAWYVVMLGAIFAGQALAVFSTVSLLGGRLGKTLRTGRKGSRYGPSRAFSCVTAAIYVGIAVMIVI